MRRIRTANRADGRTGGREGSVVVAGRSHPLSRAEVIRTAAQVLRAERRSAALSVSFLGRERMQGLNARWKGRRHPTDVLAFPLPLPRGALAGDIYICPWVAAREAEARGIPLRQELRRLVVHGVLHVLGYDHPEGERRTRSPMWRRQERYLRSAR